MPSSEIVSIWDGIAIANPSAPAADVVKEIEDLLQKAKDGQIIGIAWATTFYDMSGQNHFCGRVTRGMVGNLFGVASRISRIIDEAP